jgi:hypothetical protein
MPLIGGLYHTVGLDQMLSENMPVIGGLCHNADFDQLWSKKRVPFVGGLCHVSDFDQMWSKKMCPLSEDFVTSRTLTKCGQKCAPCRRTLSHLGLQPNMVQ